VARNKYILCKKPILNYHPEFNRLEIDESISADFCSNCIDKFIKWQQKNYARLYPTHAMKKRYNKT